MKSRYVILGLLAVVFFLGCNLRQKNDLNSIILESIPIASPNQFQTPESVCNFFLEQIRTQNVTEAAKAIPLLEGYNSNLFDKIGVIYGNGDGSTTFNIPDYRGYFIRGTDNGAGVDPDAASRTDRGDGTGGDNVGTIQQDQNKAHTHGLDNYKFNLPAGTNDYVIQGGGTDDDTGSSGGNEARPKNKNVNFIIKVY